MIARPDDLNDDDSRGAPPADAERAAAVDGLPTPTLRLTAVPVDRPFALATITNGAALAAAGAVTEMEWTVSDVSGAKPERSRVLVTTYPDGDETSVDAPAAPAGSRITVRARAGLARPSA